MSLDVVVARGMGNTAQQLLSLGEAKKRQQNCGF